MAVAQYVYLAFILVFRSLYQGQPTTQYEFLKGVFENK